MTRLQLQTTYCFSLIGWILRLSRHFHFLLFMLHIPPNQVPVHTHNFYSVTTFASIWPIGASPSPLPIMSFSSISCLVSLCSVPRNWGWGWHTHPFNQSALVGAKRQQNTFSSVRAVGNLFLSEGGVHVFHPCPSSKVLNK